MKTELLTGPTLHEDRAAYRTNSSWRQNCSQDQLFMRTELLTRPTLLEDRAAHRTNSSCRQSQDQLFVIAELLTRPTLHKDGAAYRADWHFMKTELLTGLTDTSWRQNCLHCVTGLTDTSWRQSCLQGCLTLHEDRAAYRADWHFMKTELLTGLTDTSWRQSCLQGWLWLTLHKKSCTQDQHFTKKSCAQDQHFINRAAHMTNTLWTELHTRLKIHEDNYWATQHKTWYRKWRTWNKNSYICFKGSNSQHYCGSGTACWQVLKNIVQTETKPALKNQEL